MVHSLTHEYAWNCITINGGINAIIIYLNIYGRIAKYFLYTFWYGMNVNTSLIQLFAFMIVNMILRALTASSSSLPTVTPSPTTPPSSYQHQCQQHSCHQHQQHHRLQQHHSTFVSSTIKATWWRQQRQS